MEGRAPTLARPGAVVASAFVMTASAAGARYHFWPASHVRALAFHFSRHHSRRLDLVPSTCGELCTRVYQYVRTG